MNTKMLNIIKHIFDYEHIPYEEIIDKKIIFQHKHGKINCDCECGLCVYPHNKRLKTIITEFYEVITFFEMIDKRR